MKMINIQMEIVPLIPFGLKINFRNGNLIPLTEINFELKAKLQRKPKTDKPRSS